MSILDRLKKQGTLEGKALFGVIAGPRLGGKTTLAGTLPGKTLLLQAAVLESGSESAKALAASRNAHLDVLNFNNIEELKEIVIELRTDTVYDNVYVDGLSAITDMLLKQPKIAQALKINVWEGYSLLGNVVTEVILSLKELTYPDKAKKAKATFLTCALRVKQEGTGVDVELETKGKIATSAVTKYGEAVLTVLPPSKTESGTTGHRMITKSDDIWPGRIDGLLSDQNPGTLPADLSLVLKLRNKQ